jgi:regulator of sigma E protease
MDIEQMKQPAQPWEFRSKPAWQRLIVMVGGVVMNVITAYVIFTGLLISQGSQYLPTSEVNKYGIRTSSLAQELGLKDGDKILSVNGEYIEDFSQIPMQLLLEDSEYIEVERNGEKVKVELPEDAIAKMVNSRGALMSYRIPFVIHDVVPGSIAQKAGMQKGDRIIKINEKYVPYYNEFVTEMANYANQNVDVAVVRGNDTLTFDVQLSNDAKLGVSAEPMLEYKKQEYTFLQAIPEGFSKTGKELSDYWKQLKLIFNPSTKAYESLGGFISIGSIFPSSFDWIAFWRLTAFLSIVLAVMNILPIPALDGGHVLFLLYEIITRRKPNDKFMEIAQMVGLFILLGLLIFANGNDILRLFQ